MKWVVLFLLAILVIGALLGILLVGGDCAIHPWDPPEVQAAKIRCLELRIKADIEQGWMILYTVLGVGSGSVIAGVAYLIFRFGYPVWVDGQTRRKEAEARLAAEQARLWQAQAAFVQQFPSAEKAFEFVRAANGNGRYHVDGLEEVSHVPLKVA